MEGMTAYVSESVTDLYEIYSNKHISAAALVGALGKIEGYKTAHYGDTYIQTPDAYAWFCVVQYLKEESTISVFFPWTNADTSTKKTNPNIKIYTSSESAKPNIENLIKEMIIQIRNA